MKILFVSSGNLKAGISPIVFSQGESLVNLNKDVQIDYFTIKGKGIKGYFNSISKLRNHLKSNNYEIIHAHYSLSAFVASLAGAKPLIVSLMGSDVKAKAWFKWIIYIFNSIFWNQTIVKSDDMMHSLGISNLSIIPNGVNLDIFYPANKESCQKILGWDLEKQHILFPSNPSRPEKNYALLKKATEILNNSNIIIHTLVDINHKDIPLYMNAADTVVLTSLWEGSPNAVKEAMACNRPIVSTDVGDVKTLFEHGENLLLSGFKPKELALKLDSTNIAKRIIDLYNSVINK